MSVQAANVTKKALACVTNETAEPRRVALSLTRNSVADMDRRQRHDEPEEQQVLTLETLPQAKNESIVLTSHISTNNFVAPKVNVVRLAVLHPDTFHG